MNTEYNPKFSEFLRMVEETEYATNTTATGALTIQQSARNELRKVGVAALKADLEWLYGDEFDVVETKEGIVLVAENEPGDFTFSWELKHQTMKKQSQKRQKRKQKLKPKKPNVLKS